jgi:hypothetical protein
MALYRLNSLEFVTTVELLSEQARQSGNLWLLVPLHDFANILKRKHDFSTALIVSEKYVEIFSEIGFGSLENQDKWNFTFALNLKAQLTILCLPPNSDKEEQQKTYKSAIELKLWSLHESLALGTAANRDAWVAANNVSSTAQLMGHPDVGLNALDKVITGTLNPVTLETIEDRFLETMGYTVQELFQYTMSLDVFRRARMRKHVDKLFTFLSRILKRFGTDLLDAIADPYLMNTTAVALINTGDPAGGETLCYRALSMDPERLYLCAKDTWDLLHYNIMISLARQPGKANEALEFRNENHEELEEQEKVYRTLETRLAGFEKENRLYETAKAMRDEGKLKYQDAWWNEHASEIAKAELFYGLLFEED